MGVPSAGRAEVWTARWSPAGHAGLEARSASPGSLNPAGAPVCAASLPAAPAHAAPSVAGGLQVQIGPLADPGALALEWQALEREAAPSFFTSWVARSMKAA